MCAILGMLQKKKQKQESDEEEDDDDDLSKQGGVGKKQTSGMSAFAMLAMEDAGDNESVCIPVRKSSSNVSPRLQALLMLLD